MSTLVAVGPSSDPCTDPPRPASAKHGGNTAAILNQIYDVHRISAMNAAYFAWKVEQISIWSQTYEGAIAISTALTAGSGLSTFFFMPQSWVQALTAGLASFSAVMAAVKPTLGLARRLEQHTKQYLGYQRVFVLMDKMVRELAEEEALEQHLLAAWKTTRDRFFDLKAADPTYVNRKVLDRMCKIVLQRYPASYYWVP